MEYINIPMLVGQLQENGMLPEPDMISYYVLEKERKLFLENEISDDTLAIERMILRWNIEDYNKRVEDRKPIWIYIMNYGGDIDYMYSMLDIIAASITPIYTVNMGVCASAAALIFISGKKRFMMPHSKIVIHEGSASMSGDSTKVLDASESYKKQLKAMKQYILSKTQIPPATLNRKRNNDWEIDAETCVKYGACDYIVENLGDII